MDDFSPRQFCALTVAALSAPLAMTCAAVSWQWVLLAAGAAGVLLLYLAWQARGLPPHEGYARMLHSAFGGLGGTILLALYWLWLVLSVGKLARMAVDAFPQDRAFPLIPLVLLLLAGLTAAKGAAAVCRFGSTLFLAVAALMGFTLAFGAGSVRWEALRPTGEAADALGPLAILLLPAAGLFLRDRLEPQKGGAARWYLGSVGLAAAVSLVCVGSLGETLAEASPDPFWLMSRSISVFGIVERFEAVISATLSIGFCCLLALLLSAAGKTLQAAAPVSNARNAVWAAAVPGAAAMWLAERVPDGVWTVGNLIFWGLLPILTLGIVRQKIAKEIEKKC